MRVPLRAIELGTFVLLAGCSHGSPKQAEMDRLSRTIEALRVQNTAYAKQVEELENRLFILNDRLESRSVNDQKVEVPALPTVTLHPTQAAPPPATFPSGLQPSIEAEASEPEIEYAGEAAKPSAHRPVLRLHGETGELTIVRDVQPGPREVSSSPRALQVAREGMRREESSGPVASYRKAFATLRAGNHDEALKGFKEFLRLYSTHDLADNSQYWIAECYYDRKDYAAAVREFRRVIERYPNGNKVPDALLKVGFSYLALGSTDAGRQTLSQLQRSYPRHEAATLASSKLAELDHPAGISSSTAVPTAQPLHTREEAP